MLKPYLVDVPVRVNIWIRPECQRKQFEVLKQARPSIIFLQSDGGRNEKEWEAIRKNRKIFEEEVDWDCTIHKLYEEENQGLYTMGKKVSKYIWEHVDRCIFLEDDFIPAVSFFQYCAELLEKYKDDTRISCICGMNHLGVYEDASSDYFFSRQGSIWGVANWRRSHELRNPDHPFANDPYTMKLLNQRTRKNPTFRRVIKGYAKGKYFEGHVAGAEFFVEFSMYGHNQLQIIPKKNMICNIGCTENGTHATTWKQTPKGLRKLFNMKTYEMEFPMKHPEYVIPDTFYEKKRNRTIAYNYPLVKFYRRIESALLAIKSGSFFKRLKKKISKLGAIEK